MLGLLAALFLCGLMAAGLLNNGIDINPKPPKKQPQYKEELIEKGYLKVLVSPDYPPFAENSDNGPWGYDIAVANEIANRMGLQIEYITTPRSTIIETLACEPLPGAQQTLKQEDATSGGSEPEAPEPIGDIAIAALAITPDRDDKVDFSSWYCVGDQAVVTLAKARQTLDSAKTGKSQASSAAQLPNSTTALQPNGIATQPDTALIGPYQSTKEFDKAKTRIAVVKGSTCLQTACSLTSENLVVEYSTARKCLQALQANEVQAAVLDLPVARYLLNNGYSDMRILEYVMTGEEYGIALPSTSPNLKAAINQVIAEMEKDGTLERLAAEFLN